MTLASERLAKGLCPRCGKEAAPYRLCQDHRFEGTIARFLRAAQKAGYLERTAPPSGPRNRVWVRATEKARSDKDKNWLDVTFRSAEQGDKRLRPRLGRVPVDVEREIIGILMAFGRPATIEEIVAAWGNLREERKTASLAGDMVALISAQRRREERNMKRLGLARPHFSEG